MVGMTQPGNRPSSWRPLLAEFLGTGLLVAVVVGSGIAAQRLSPDDTGLQLLENSLATAFGLVVLIYLFGPLSGPHFNPVVTLALAVADRGERRVERILGYITAQVLGAIGGSLLANAMFAVAPSISTTDRVDAGRLLSEVVATAVLMLLILGLLRTGRPTLAAPLVALFIGAAYWFTSSTSFANPAVTVGRIFSDTFAGIEPTSAAWFVGAQLVGAAIGTALAIALFSPLRIQAETSRSS
jgi:glycerol uptake facilitator-like aquaporin